MAIMHTLYISLARSWLVVLGLLMGLGVGLSPVARALELAPAPVMACVYPCDIKAAHCLATGYGAFCQPTYHLCVERCDPAQQFFETFSRVHPEAVTRLNPAASLLTRSEVQRSLCVQACDMNAITCSASNAINTPICRNGRLQCMDRCNEGQDSSSPLAKPR